ncbi:MAG TPA: DUF1801 domain-containing protein [Actinomycetota bacterium]|nr:DUF1801 domain-containing protein [Actinomycetota bacterium]
MREGDVATEIDAYLEEIPAAEREALEKIRKAIHAAAPDVTEGISYRVPTFKYRSHPLVGFGVTKKHCTFYVMSTDVTDAFAEELETYETGKGSIRFQPSKAPSAALIRKLVKARIAEVESGRY